MAAVKVEADIGIRDGFGNLVRGDFRQCIEGLGKVLRRTTIRDHARQGPVRKTWKRQHRVPDIHGRAPRRCPGKRAVVTRKFNHAVCRLSGDKTSLVRGHDHAGLDPHDIQRVAVGGLNLFGGDHRLQQVLDRIGISDHRRIVCNPSRKYGRTPNILRKPDDVAL
jgi:hypothetical protein